jgi:hypothetical protein
MQGETNLNKLLATLSPELIAGDFVFCSFDNAQYGDYSDLAPIAAVTESEGLTLVIPRTKADEQGLKYESVFRCITLKVHSSLDAVGLTAAFSGILAEQGISANVVAGYFHDHVFVPHERADEAIAAINELAHE